MTVCREMNRRSLICWFEQPRAIRRSTASSRLLRVSATPRAAKSSATSAACGKCNCRASVKALAGIACNCSCSHSG
ncbi:hypothetical protein D3C78_1386780 [compost metagenome]